MLGGIAARITARKGVLSSLPILLPGELGLATDYQRLFIGQEPITGVCDITASTNTVAKVEFTSGSGDVIDMDFILVAPSDWEMDQRMKAYSAIYQL